MVWTQRKRVHPIRSIDFAAAICPLEMVGQGFLFCNPPILSLLQHLSGSMVQKPSFGRGCDRCVRKQIECVCSAKRSDSLQQQQTLEKPLIAHFDRELELERRGRGVKRRSQQVLLKV